MAYTITADVEVKANGNGVIVCQGGRFGGLALYMKNGKPATQGVCPSCGTKMFKIGKC